MSLNSTLESLNGTVESADGISQQIFVTESKVRNQHLNHAQIRGVRQLFNHFFPKTPGKRMNKDEKNRRWNSYKNKIYQQYRRIITGKWQSEKTLIKRYSEPLRFVPYFSVTPK